MSDRIRDLPERTKFQILAPIVRGKKGTHQKVLSSLAAEGFVRVRVEWRNSGISRSDCLR